MSSAWPEYWSDTAVRGVVFENSAALIGLVIAAIASPQFEQLRTMVEADAAVERIVSLRARYSGPEEVLVMAKIHPSSQMKTEELARAMDDLDRRIRQALPYLADVFIDVTANRTGEHPALPQ